MYAALDQAAAVEPIDVVGDMETVQCQANIVQFIFGHFYLPPSVRYVQLESSCSAALLPETRNFTLRLERAMVSFQPSVCSS